MTAEAMNVCGIEIPWTCRELQGFRAWVASLEEGGPRVSYARGRMHVEVSPQNYETHEPLVGAINAALRSLATALDLGRYFMPPSWFTHEASLLSTEPDGFLALWSTLTGAELGVNPDRKVEMLGRPDMVLEVVSATSERKDLEEHVDDYAAAGIREYWIADGRRDQIVFRILSLDGSAYVEASADADGWVVSPIWQRRFRVRRFVDRAGMSDFALDVEVLVNPVR